MRINQPVTSIETPVPENTFIYSRTDLQGRILEANEAFARISGFEVSEMLGQPHNLIRHPDMPEAAFADMWATLKSGRPWRGVVKNRRKDGGFYWVVANASPVRENGRVVAYQSVRTRPTREEIAAAENVYRQLRAGSARFDLHQGAVHIHHNALTARAFAFDGRLSAFVLLALLAGVAGLIGSPWESWQFWANALLTVAAAAMLAFDLPRAFGRLRALREQIDTMLRDGDLRQSPVVTGADLIGALGENVGTLCASMRATLQIVGDTTREVAEATDGLSTSVHRLVSAAASQSEVTTSAAAGVEEMTVAIGEVARHAASTHEVSRDAGERSRQGALLSEQASSTIEKLAELVSDSASTVETLGGRTEEIGKVAGVIKEIADQTNLLALNAAIEAARAGEQGRGFAVVADEVRKLAERTAGATHEIDQMIARIHGETQSAVEGMRRSAEQVGTSVSLVREAHAALQEIQGEMQTTAQMVADISHSSSEQSAAMEMMAQNVEHVASLTDDNLATARHTEQSAQLLEGSVGRMRKAVAQYQV